MWKTSTPGGRNRVLLTGAALGGLKPAGRAGREVLRPLRKSHAVCAVKATERKPSPVATNNRLQPSAAAGKQPAPMSLGARQF